MLIKSNKKKNIIALVNILSTSNNTIINISDIFGKTLLFGSGGLLGIKGSRRSTSYAGEAISNVLGKIICVIDVLNTKASTPIEVTPSGITRILCIEILII